MDLKLMARYCRRIGTIGLAGLVFGASMGCGSLFKAKTPPPFGYHALKINGTFVEPEVFFKEKNSFFLHGRRNVDMLRKSDEERTDMILENVIDKTATEDYLYRLSGIRVTPQEVNDYLERYTKAGFASPKDFSSFLTDNGYKDEADLRENIRLYLFKLRCFPRIAKEMGMSISQRELDSLYQKHVEANTNQFKSFCHPKAEFADMTMLEKFGGSAQFKTWVAGIKSRMSIEILDPAMKAFRIYREGRYGQAGALYEKAFRKRHKELYLQRAIESYGMAERWKKVIRLSGTGMKKYPENILYDLDKAEGLYRSGKVSDAVELLKTAEIRCRGSVSLKQSVVDMYMKLGLEKEAEGMRNGPSK